MGGRLGLEGAIVVAIYLVAMLAVGWHSSRRVKTLSDFVVAGQSMNRWVIAFSIIATWVSGTTMLALPASGYTNGLAIFFFGACASLASGLWIGYYVVPLMRRANIMTVPELFERWFGIEHRLAAVVAVWARDLAYVGSCLISIGMCINYTTGISYGKSVMLGAGVTVLYMVMGGQRAVMLTEFAQNSIIMSLTIYMLLALFSGIGGWHAFVSRLELHHKTISSGYSPSNLNAWLVMGLFQCFAYQALIQRGLTARNVREVQRGFLIGGVLGCVWYVTIPLLGMLGYAYYGPGQKPEDVFLTLASRQFPPLVYALLVVLLLAAIMSTLASVLMSVSSNFIVDIYARLSRGTTAPKRAVLVSRLSVVIGLAVGIVFAFVFPVLLELLWIGTRITVCTVGPVVAALCLYKRVRRAPKTVLAAMISGGVAAVLAFVLGSGTKAAVVVLWGIDPIYVGLPVNILVLVIGTYLETRNLSRGDLALTHTRRQTVPDAQMDEELPRFNPYLAMALTVGAMFVYYIAWIAALQYL